MQSTVEASAHKSQLIRLNKGETIRRSSNISTAEILRERPGCRIVPPYRGPGDRRKCRKISYPTYSSRSSNIRAQSAEDETDREIELERCPETRLTNAPP